VTIQPWEPRQFSDKKEIEFSVGSVQGLRWWHLHGEMLRGSKLIWQTQTNPTYQAFCLIQTGNFGVYMPTMGMSDISLEHSVPTKECGCGYWAFWKYHPCPIGNPFSRSSSICIVGVIKGFGRTVIGSKGFRAQKARILGLHIVDSGQLLDSELIEVEFKLEDLYHVPVYRSFRLLINEHPPTTDYLQAEEPENPPTSNRHLWFSGGTTWPPTGIKGGNS